MVLEKSVVVLAALAHDSLQSVDCLFPILWQVLWYLVFVLAFAKGVRLGRGRIDLTDEVVLELKVLEGPQDPTHPVPQKGSDTTNQAEH